MPACTASSSLLYVRLKQRRNSLRTAYHEVNHSLTYVLTKHRASSVTTSIQVKRADFSALQSLPALLKKVSLQEAPTCNQQVFFLHLLVYLLQWCLLIFKWILYTKTVFNWIWIWRLRSVFSPVKYYMYLHAFTFLNNCLTLYCECQIQYWSHTYWLLLKLLPISKSTEM